METAWAVKPLCDDLQGDWRVLPVPAPPQPGGPHSPLQFLAILNMLAALVYISQASSTLVLPLEGSERQNPLVKRQLGAWGFFPPPFSWQRNLISKHRRVFWMAPRP